MSEKDKAIERIRKRAKDFKTVSTSTETPATVVRCGSECEECHGLQYVRFDVPVGHPRFGKLYPCVNLPVTSSIYDKDSGLIGNERSHVFDEIELRDGSNIEEAVSAVVGMLNRGSGMVLLYGGFGLGKTLLAKIAVAEIIRKKDYRFARYRLFPDLVEELREVYSSENSIVSVVNEYSSIDLLCIDELGVERETEFSMEKQFMIINNRYEAAIERGEKIMTLICTNKPLSELPPRLVDRWQDGRCSCVKVEGKSFRPSQERMEIE